ncbi:MAG: RNA polymerase sigma-54 factor, partial [Bacteroidaceae bacterium]|nr:RNA polymerase sigma-54 factor [Bacteroidaceae bacterium]
MLKQQLQQKLQQKLSPQQIQVIRLLELTTVEFEERVKQELVENPALDEGATQPEEKDFTADNDNNDSEDISLGDYYSEDDIPEYKLEERRAKTERREEIPFSGSSSFHDYLIKQLGERNLNAEQ